MPDNLFEDSDDPLTRLRDPLTRLRDPLTRLRDAGKPSIKKVVAEPAKVEKPAPPAPGPAPEPVASTQPEPEKAPSKPEAPSVSEVVEDVKITKADMSEARRKLKLLIPEKPDPASAASRYERAMEERRRIELVIPEVEEDKPEPTAVLYEKAVAPEVAVSLPSFKEWAYNMDEATLSSLDGHIQDFLRVVRSDRGFPESDCPGPIVVHLQSLRVNRRVIDTAVQAFKMYEREIRGMHRGR